MLSTLSTSRCRKTLFRKINIEIKNEIKYSKTNMCRNMKYYTGDLVGDLRKTNQGRPPKVYFWKMKNILQQTGRFEDVWCKKVNSKTRYFTKIFYKETVSRVPWKAGINLNLFQRMESWRKNDIRLKINLLEKYVISYLKHNFLKEDVGFCFDKADFTHKINPFN